MKTRGRRKRRYPGLSTRNSKNTGKRRRKRRSKRLAQRKRLLDVRSRRADAEDSPDDNPKHLVCFSSDDSSDAAEDNHISHAGIGSFVFCEPLCRYWFVRLLFFL